jgi:hypothetical protein
VELNQRPRRAWAASGRVSWSRLWRKATNLSLQIKLGALIALLAIPAIALAAGEGGSGIQDVGLQQTGWNHGAQNATTSWQPVPGLAFNPNTSDERGNVTVSADMRSGPALFRAVTVRPGPDAVAQPGAVRFNATGSQAFTFHVGVGCAGGIQVEWKRAGASTASLVAASAHVLYDQTGCG